MEDFKGYVEHIVYRNEDNGYTVFYLSTSECDEITCVGNIPFIDEGEFFHVCGEMTDHPSYGLQLKVSFCESSVPEDTLSIERYLGSGAIKGIGPKLAASIVKMFGEDTIRIIEEEPERLAEVKGISLKKAMDISVQADSKKDTRSAMLFLQKYGISNRLANKIYERYGQNLYTVINDNPYRLAEDVEGIGFKTADEIAMQMGIRYDDEYRVKSGIIFCLQQASTEGHCFLPRQELTTRTAALLGIYPDDIDRYVMDLAFKRSIVLGADEELRPVYLNGYYQAELSVARMLHDLNISYPGDMNRISQRIKKIEKEEGITLDDLQRTAVTEAINHGLLVITGGPGTGKTTTINTMIRYFESEGKEVMLAAPTGRAAKRMSEATGHAASTIHRLLEVSAVSEDWEKRGSIFQRDEENPLEADVIIIDEMSMIDIHLMQSLLRAVVPGTRLILVGDSSQLPSVGPGSVLKDIISSHCFNMVMLTRIFRQAAESDIIVNAHRINDGEDIDLSNNSKDFFFLKRDDANLIISNLITLIRSRLPEYVGACASEIQVLTPMRKGLLGVERLNKILQEYLNPPSPDKTEHTAGELTLRTGDKVMQIKNDYNLEWEIRGFKGIAVSHGAGVFNGDSGTVLEINKFDESLTVVYDDNRYVTYGFSQLDELELAYAITIHKSQGSEYPAVLLPLLSGPAMLFNRNLLYTAVTRASKCVTILGKEETIRDMIANTREAARYTSLSRRIREMGE